MSETLPEPGYYFDRPESETGYVVTPLGEAETNDVVIEVHRADAAEAAARRGGELSDKPPRITHLTYSWDGESHSVRCLQWEMTR